MSTNPVSVGPCQAWITGDDVLDAGCDAASNAADLDQAALIASGVLYELSGRRYPGVCTRTVRPCRSGGCGCFPQMISPATWVWAGGRWCDEDQGVRCGCGVEQRIKLAPYPVTTVTEVLISGAVVDPATYRLEGRRYLVRVTGNGGWPTCQDMAAADGAEGTFLVSYEWGVEPPTLGALAVAQLACEVYKAQTGAGDCALPADWRTIVRQGVTYQRDVNADAGQLAGAKGMSLVSEFLATYGGPRRRPAFWGPSSRNQYPRRA